MSYPQLGNWTVERVAQLHQLVADGLSGGQIGAALGVTRNTIIGKVRRLGLSLLHAKTPPKPRVPRKRARLPWQPKIIHQPFPTEATDLPPEPVANPVTLMQLNEHTCRWPVHQDGETALFCGAAPLAGTPYCSHHNHIGHQRRYTSAEIQRKLMRQRGMRRTASGGVLAKTFDKPLQNGSE